MGLLLLLYAIGNGIWGKQHRDARKRKSKGVGGTIRGWPKPYTPNPQTLRADSAGGAYARSDGALKQMGSQ